MVRAVLFDLDGTLVDSAPDIHACVNAVLAAAGVEPLSAPTVRGFIGGGVSVLMRRVIAATGLPDSRHAELCARFIAHYEESLGGLTRPYDGVEAALDALSHLPLGLCTNKPEGPTRALLAHLGWGGRFSVIVGGDTTATPKPDPAPLNLAISRIGGGPVLFVGDSEVDAETARAAGVPLLLFTQGYRSTPVAGLPHQAAFDHWREMPALVR